MSSTKPLRIGFIGTGGIALNAHLPAWQACPDTEIVAVADVSEEAARKFVIATGGQAQVFADYRDLLRLDLDAVDVCTPNKVHTPAVVAALEAGKHVLCEKPLAVSTGEIEAIGAAVKSSGKVLMSAQHLRFTPAARAIRDWADQGNLGEVYYARVQALRRNLLPARPGFTDVSLSGGGPCFDIGVHALDLALWLMDFPTPVRVTGTTRVNFAKGHKIPGLWGNWSREAFSVEDFASGFIHFDNGATMAIETSWLGHQQENEVMACQLYGLEGGVKWPSTEFASTTGTTFTQGSLTSSANAGKPHHEVVKAFVASIREGIPPAVPWTETLKVIAILEAIYRSAREGREIAIDATP
ncbi:MAG: gfo/Idh/MocA family oxidoreductase [Puniceicoccaceae bacterium]|nr:MAG: gfo/Idh/MocA family oxidoreductase [Puniceicoccaceae bacterium]